jgi:hypothetical protein
MKAADVMVSAVISVRPSARVEEVAGILLASRRIVAAIDAQCDCPRWHSRPVGICRFG